MNSLIHKYSITYTRGISLIEILVAIAIIGYFSVPIIQLILSFKSAYILEVIKNIPIYMVDIGDSTSIKKIHRNDGKIEMVYKKGGMKEIHSLAYPSIDSENRQIGVFTRNSCVDFNSELDFNSDNAPFLHVYTNEEMGIDSNIVLTHIALMGNSLLISADSASTSDPDIYSFDVLSPTLYTSNSPFTPTKPTLVKSTTLDTGPGISQMQTYGKYSITSNTGVRSQAHVLKIDINTRNTVQATSKVFDFSIPGSNSSTTPITKSILYANQKVFVGTEKSVLPEIVVFNAQNGNVVGSIELGYGVNDMLIVDELLIVAGPRNPEIEIFSTLDFRKIGEYDLAGGSGNAKVLTVFGDNLYVGRTKGGNEIEIFSINKSSAENMMPLLSPLTNHKIRWSVDVVLKNESYSMFFTADEFAEFQLFYDADGTEIREIYKVDLPNRVSNALCIKNSIWMTFRNDDESNAYRLGVLVFPQI